MNHVFRPVNRSSPRSGKILPLSAAEAADASLRDGFSGSNLDSDDIWIEEAEFVPSNLPAPGIETD